MNIEKLQSDHKMDKRKKRTAYHQYVIYLKMLEEDQIFRTGIIPRDGELNYLTVKWEELAERLNTCGHGPIMSADEWKKRLNDWKNSTRAKFRKCQSEQYKLADRIDTALTPLEEKALLLWGPLSNKSLNATADQSSTYILPIEHVDIKASNIISIKPDLTNEIVIEPVETQNEPPPLAPLPTADAPTILLNQPLPVLQTEGSPQHSAKRRRLDSDEDQTFGMLNLRPNISQGEMKAITIELRRIANAKEEKLKFEIAKFKFRNPGFDYSYEPATSSTTESMDKQFENDTC